MIKIKLLVNIVFLLGYLGINTASQAQSQYIFQDTGRSVKQRVEDLIERMTLEEKIDLLSGYKNFNLHPCERLGIPAFCMADGPLGIASWGEYGRGTAFPATLALAASWNTELASRLGTYYAEEWRSRGIHFMLGPGVNTYRASKGARNFEYMGEDPFLTSEMVVPFIKAVQKGGVAATVKHFAANDQEFDRYRVSTEVSERALREIYLPPFKAAVQKAGVKAVMTGYNLVNGAFCTENKFLIDILKKEWGFKGILMSDWDCTHSDKAIINGLDMEMGSQNWLIREKLLPMVKEGKISEELINEKVRRIYSACMEMGFFDRDQNDSTIPTFNANANHMALQVAEEGTILLKNKEHILPLDKKKINKIAVIGPNACYRIINDVKNSVSAISYGGGGSSRVHPWYAISPLDGIMAEFPEAEVSYTEGVSTELSTLSYRRENFHTFTGEKGFKAHYYKLPGSKTLIPEDAKPLIERVDKLIDFEWEKNPDNAAVLGDSYGVRWEGYIHVDKTDSLCFFVQTQGGSRLWIDDKLLYDASGSSSFSTCNILVPVRKGEQRKVILEYYNNLSMPSEVHMGCVYQSELDFSEAKKMASQADIVVFCAGLDGFIEREGRDRPFELTYGQELLIKELARVNPNLIVTVQAGGGIQMESWIDQARAVLHLFYPGQEGGKALARILSGAVTPSAKLPFTIEKRWEDSPAFGNYDETRDERKIYYREGVFVGYRGYDQKQITPLFPFGFGLSYTTFEYSNLRVKVEDKKNAKVQVSFAVKNTGKCSGSEVVQLYIHDKCSKESRPLKELKGFSKVFLNPGETKEIRLSLDKDAFQYFNEKCHKWVLEQGTFELWIGASSQDIRLKEEVKL